MKHLYQRQFWLFSVCHCLVTYFIWSKNKGPALKWCVISSRLTLSQLTSRWLMFRLIYVMGLADWRILFLSTYMPSQKLLRLLLLLILLTTVCCRFGSWGLFIKPNIWPIEVTKARRTQPSGPLCLWQCLIYETGEYFSKLYFWQTNTIYQHQGIYKLAWACTSQWALNTRMTIDSISIKSLKVFEKILLFCFVH